MPVVTMMDGLRAELRCLAYSSVTLIVLDAFTVLLTLGGIILCCLFACLPTFGPAHAELASMLCGSRLLLTLIEKNFTQEQTRTTRLNDLLLFILIAGAGIVGPLVLSTVEVADPSRVYMLTQAFAIWLVCMCVRLAVTGRATLSGSRATARVYAA